MLYSRKKMKKSDDVSLYEFVKNTLESVNIRLVRLEESFQRGEVTEEEYIRMRRRRETMKKELENMRKEIESMMGMGKTGK